MPETARYVLMRGLRRTVGVLAVAVAAVSLVGCAEEDKPVTLPSLTPSSATPTSTVGLTDEEQIRALYTDYATNWRDAQDLPPSERKEFLSQWTVGAQRSGLLDILTDHDKKHYRYEGRVTPHIFDVRFEGGSRAKVDNCSDDSKAAIVNTRTGEQVTEDYDRPHWYVASLKRTKHGWRIYANMAKEESCVGR